MANTWGPGGRGAEVAGARTAGAGETHAFHPAAMRAASEAKTETARAAVPGSPAARSRFSPSAMAAHWASARGRSWVASTVAPASPARGAVRLNDVVSVTRSCAAWRNV